MTDRRQWIAFFAVLLGMAVGIVATVAFCQSHAGAATDATMTRIAGEPIAWIGIDIQNVDATTAEALNIRPGDGVLVSRVFEGSPADKAGIQPGDVIVRFDRQKTADLASMQETLASLSVGDTVKVNIIRDGSRRSVYITIGARPGAVSLVAGSDTAAVTPGPSWAMVVSALTSEQLSALNLPDVKGGVIVVEVYPGGLSAGAGIQPGDVVIGVNSHKVEDMETLYERLAKDDAVVLDIYRNGEERFVSVDAAGAVLPLARIAGTTDSSEGYQGKPPVIPPMGSATAGILPQNSSNRSLECICLSCGTRVLHPAGVSCADLACPVCGQRMTSANAGALTTGPAAIPPMGQRTGGQPGTIPPMGQRTGGQPDTIPPMGQRTGGQPGTIPPMGQRTGGQPGTIPPMGQPTGGQTDAIPPMGQPNVERPDSRPPPIGRPTGGQPDTIPPMGGTTGGQPDTIPPMGQTSAGGPAAGTVQSTATVLTGECLCPLCGTTVYHPLGVPCSSLTCPVCGSRLVNASPGQNTLSQPSTSPSSTLPGTAGQGAANQARNFPILPVPSNTNNTIVYPRLNLGQGFGVAPSLSDVTPMQQQGRQTLTIAGSGLGQGGGSNLAGPGGYCICPNCGATAEHEASIPCTQLQCPICGSMMVRALNTPVAGAPGAVPTVAIAVAGSSLDSNVAAFDTAPNYVFVDLSNGTAQIIPNPNVGDVANVGAQSAQFVVDRGADTVIANSFSDGALSALTRLRTGALSSLFGSVQEVINSYFNMLRGPTFDSSPPSVSTKTPEEEEGRKYGLTKERASSKSKGEASL